MSDKTAKKLCRQAMSAQIITFCIFVVTGSLVATMLMLSIENAALALIAGMIVVYMVCQACKYTLRRIQKHYTEELILNGYYVWQN